MEMVMTTPIKLVVVVVLAVAAVETIAPKLGKASGPWRDYDESYEDIPRAIGVGLTAIEMDRSTPLTIIETNNVQTEVISIIARSFTAVCQLKEIQELS